MARTKQVARSVSGEAPRQLLVHRTERKRRDNYFADSPEELQPAKRQRTAPKSSALKLSNLSADILINVLFKFMRYKDVLKLSLVDKESRSVILDPKHDKKIWKDLVVKQLLGYEPLAHDLEQLYDKTYFAKPKSNKASNSSKEGKTEIYSMPQLWFLVFKNYFYHVRGRIAEAFKKLGIQFSSIAMLTDLTMDAVKLTVRPLPQAPKAEKRQSSAALTEWNKKTDSFHVFQNEEEDDAAKVTKMQESAELTIYMLLQPELDELKKNDELIILGPQRVYIGDDANKKLERCALPGFSSYFSESDADASFDLMNLDPTKANKYSVFAKTPKVPTIGNAFLVIKDEQAFKAFIEKNNAETEEEEDYDPAKWYAKQFAVGESKVGGFPDFPANLEPPKLDGKYTPLMAQINITQLKLCDLSNQLPSDGMLWIFLPHSKFSYYTLDDFNVPIEPRELEELKKTNYVIHMSNAEIKQYGGLVPRYECVADHRKRSIARNTSYLMHPMKLAPLSPAFCNYEDLPADLKMKISKGQYEKAKRPGSEGMDDKHVWMFGTFDEREVTLEHLKDNCRLNILSLKYFWKEPVALPPRAVIDDKDKCYQYVKESSGVYVMFQDVQRMIVYDNDEDDAELPEPLSSDASVRSTLDYLLHMISDKAKHGFTAFDHRKAYRQITHDYLKGKSLESLPPMLAVAPHKYLNHEETVQYLKSKSRDSDEYIIYKQLENPEEAVGDSFSIIYEFPYSFSQAIAKQVLSSKIKNSSELENIAFPRPKSYVNLFRLHGRDLGPEHYDCQYWNMLIPSNAIDTRLLRGAVILYSSD